MSDEALVDGLDVVWTSLADLGTTLSEREWLTETECPGWTVQDNLAHIIGIEATILGRPNPDHAPAGGPHIKNDVGAGNEIWVDWYRSRSGAEVLADFRSITAERISHLRAPGYDFGAETWTPVGPGTVRDLLPFRVFDSWIHEQDMRRALRRPGDADSVAASASLDRIESIMPMVVGKKVAPPDGTVVAFTVEGPVGRAFAIEVAGGRAGFLDSVPAAPSVHLEMDTDTFVRLASGRGDPESILASGAVTLIGDPTLGRAIAENMNFLF
ncbi:MAG: maleylpyruvate isomerase family mycothiol-dependent enzyme [Acidimicrobiia bacterium]